MPPDPIFEPLVLPNLSLKNRIVRSSIGGPFDHYNGSGSWVRINWDEKFAAGGVAAIISSVAPIDVRGRVVPGFASIDRDDRIPFWTELGEAIHAHDCAYIIQLAYAGRQRDVHGIENRHRAALGPSGGSDPIHGLTSDEMTVADIEDVQRLFAAGARRAKSAGLDGVEIHAAHGYLFSQFLSPTINRRDDRYGGSLDNRARFLIETLRTVRSEVGDDFHVQVKINGADRHDAIVPGAKPGITVEDAVEVGRQLAAVGVDALHVSGGDAFPHPLNPPGGFPIDELARGYGPMLGQGKHALRNYLVFRTRLFHGLLRSAWRRGAKGRAVEAAWLPEAAQIRREVGLPVICVGGFQRGTVIRDAITSGACDAVAIARPLVANNDLVETLRTGADMPERPCSFCNRCLYNIVTNPMGCYDTDRFDGDHDAMVAEIMSVYEPTR